MAEPRKNESREDRDTELGGRQTVMDHLLAPLFGVRTEYRLAVSVLATVIESLDVLLASLRPGDAAREPEEAKGQPYAAVNLQVRAPNQARILRFLDRLHETEAVERVIVSSMGENRATVVVLLGAGPEAHQEGGNPTMACAWCDKVISQGGPQVSHGLCSDCAADLQRGGGRGPA